jgi:hypothetical protein
MRRVNDIMNNHGNSVLLYKHDITRALTENSHQYHYFTCEILGHGTGKFHTSENADFTCEI